MLRTDGLIYLAPYVQAFPFQTVRVVFPLLLLTTITLTRALFVSVYVHDPGPNKSYDDGVIYMRTRRAVATQRAEDLSETYSDKEIKDRFLQAIGDKFDPKELIKRHTFVSRTIVYPRHPEHLHIRILPRYIHPCPYILTTIRLTKSMLRSLRTRDDIPPCPSSNINGMDSNTIVLLD